MSGAADRALLDAAENPFSDPVVRLEAQAPPPPDVASIHKNVRVEIHRAIELVRAQRRPSIVLVKGDPGQGKTHQLAWLQHRADEGAYYFVEIPPLKDAAAPFSHILRYMVQGLHAHRAAAGLATSSLDRLLWECLRRVAAAVHADALERRDDASDEVAATVGEALLGDGRMVDTFALLAPDVPGLGGLLYARGRTLPPLTDLMADLGRVLCRMTDQSAQPAVFDWLRGAELPDEDLALLGVKRAVESEERAYDVLHAIVSLSTKPIALCFDQLESTSGLLGIEGAVALFNALMEIYQKTPACLVLMCQTQHWSDLRDKVLPAAARDRVRELPPLALPTPDEALQLVEARLAPLWRAAQVQPPYASYPFRADYVHGLVAAMRPTIRQVLAACGERLDAMRRAQRIEEAAAAPAAPTPAPRPAPDAVLTALAYHRDQALRRIEEGALREPRDRQEFLREGAVRILAVAAERGRPVGGVRVLAVSDTPRPKAGQRPPAFITIAAAGGAKRRVALDVHNGDSRSVWRVLQRLVEQVEARGAAAAVLLREAAVPIGETAKHTQELAARLAEQGGGVVYLEREAAHRLVGAELLLDAVSAAEVWAGDRAVTRDEALRFLLEEEDLGGVLAPVLSRVALPAPAAPPAPAPAPAQVPGDLATQIVRLLRFGESPIMSLPAVAAALGVAAQLLEEPVRSLQRVGALRVGPDRDGVATLALIAQASR
jgi:hypothetical protein